LHAALLPASNVARDVTQKCRVNVVKRMPRSPLVFIHGLASDVRGAAFVKISELATKISVLQPNRRRLTVTIGD
jgi:hypothetical protein